MAKPRRDPQRIPTNARLDLPIVRTLEDQAEEVDLKLLTYIEVVLAAAHGYSGTYLPEVDLSRMPLTATQLKRRTARLTASDCIDVSRDNQLKSMKIEEPLLDLIRTTAADMGVAYSAYIRAILREAAGLKLPGRGVQSSLDDITLPRGGGQLRRAS